MAEIAAFGPEREARVLDIAAGHGIFGVMMAHRNPKVEVYALDWPNVLAVASENAAKFGVGARHHLIPGDAFSTEFQGPYDLVLLTNFLHHFDPPTNESLLRKIGSALKDGGRVFTLEFVPNPDRISPPGPALFSTVMLAGTPAGDAYTLAELEEMFRNAGFSRNEVHTMPGMGQTLVVSER
jgi:2-polyprenyl-3-methyl-5-hydroxy-6-metoxy-1,4-benzoquinol methylase